MTRPAFVKYYPDPRRRAAAHRHHTWLSTLDSGVRLPRLDHTTRRHLVFEHLDGHRPGPGHLPQIAAALGRLRAAAHRQHLHTAVLTESFTTTGGLVIADFDTPRRAALQRLPLPTHGLPVALYKDANIRNFILTGTDTDVALVDFDDLTLAPFGYDLAKLIVSAAMTHGRLPTDQVTAALNAYNAPLNAIPGAACPLEQLRAYAEFHHLLTANYLHRNGYRHPWPAVRPWPAPPTVH